MTKEADKVVTANSTAAAFEEFGKGWPWGDVITAEETDRIIRGVTAAAWQSVNYNLQQRARFTPGQELPYSWFVYAAQNVIINATYEGFATLLLSLDPSDGTSLASFKTMIADMGKNLLRDVVVVMERMQLAEAAEGMAEAKSEGKVQ